MAGTILACGPSISRTPPQPPLTGTNEPARAKQEAPSELLSEGGVAVLANTPRNEHSVLCSEPEAPATSTSTVIAENVASTTELPEATYLRPLTIAVPPLGERFANLAPWECRRELARRKLPVARASLPAVGVATPLRLTGPLGSVTFRTAGKKSPYGILDCRLVLLLDALSSHLERLSVKEVRVDNLYRPGAYLKGRRRVPSQHAHGLALDITRFVLSDGTELDVERDFHGELSAPVCGPEAVLTDPNRSAILLRNIVCELGRLGAFNYFLTPNYDPPHRNHLHADIKRKCRDHVVK